MHILVRVSLPAAAAQREQSGGESSSSGAPDVAPSTSSSHSSLFAIDFVPSSSPLASVAERALREAGHPDARRALESGEWRAVFEAAALGTAASSSLPLLSVAPFSLPGGKGGFGSLLRASGRVSKVTDRGACRDLSGRRVKHVEQEKAAADWLAAAPARAEAEAARKQAAEEAGRRAREEVSRVAEASVDAEALKKERERAARETAAAVAEAEGRKEEEEKRGRRRRRRGDGGGGGRGRGQAGAAALPEEGREWKEEEEEKEERAGRPCGAVGGGRREQR